MATQNQKGKAIYAGFDWRYRFVVRGSKVLPAAINMVGQVRPSPTSDTVLTTLSTADGPITKINATTVEVFIDNTISAAWTEISKVSFDLISIDDDEPQHLGFLITVPVRRAITKPGDFIS